MSQHDEQPIGVTTIVLRGTTLTARIRPTRLGDMLRLSRTVQQKSLRDYAAEIGIGHATLMRIEHGQAFDAETLLKLWAWLLGRKDGES